MTLEMAGSSGETPGRGTLCPTPGQDVGAVDRREDLGHTAPQAAMDMISLEGGQVVSSTGGSVPGGTEVAGFSGTALAQVVESTLQEAALEDSTFLEIMTSSEKKKKSGLDVEGAQEASSWVNEMNMEEGDPKSPSSPPVTSLEWNEVHRSKDRGLNKQIRKSGPGGEISFGQPRQAEIGVGDWRCPKQGCKDWINYSWRTACMKCRAPRLGMGGERGRLEGGMEVLRNDVDPPPKEDRPLAPKEQSNKTLPLTRFKR